jgi:hypothetical protein
MGRLFHMTSDLIDRGRDREGPNSSDRLTPRRGEHFNPKFSVEKALLNSRSHENELAFWLDMALSPSETSGSHPHFKLPKQSYLQ